MEYQGSIGIDMTGGDSKEGRSIVERTIKYTHKAVKKYPEYLFFLAGPADQLNQAHFPGNARIIHAPQHHYYDRKNITEKENNLETPLIKLLQIADEKNLDAIVTHAKAKIIQQNTIRIPGLNKVGLRKVSGLKRAALAAIIPTKQKHKYVLALDVGANYSNDNHQLEQFAYLGAIIAKYLFNTSNPTAAKLNICEEANFGPPQYQEIYQQLKQNSKINFRGFVEDKHFLGLISHYYRGKLSELPDVLLAEGYDGNRLIKSMEATASLTSEVIKEEMFPTQIPIVSHIVNYVRALSLLPIIHRTKKRLQPEKYGGALLAGVRTRAGKDIAFIKGHGEADEGIFHGIKRAIFYTKEGLMKKINQDLEAILKESREQRK